MYLADALGVIACLGQFPDQDVFMLPGNAVLMADMIVVTLPHPRMEDGPGDNTAGTDAICMIKRHVGNSQHVKIRHFHVGVTDVSRTVPPKLIGHKKNNIRAVHSDIPLLLYHHSVINLRNQALYEEI